MIRFGNFAIRALSGGALVGVLLLGVVGAGSPGFAQERETREVRNVIIKRLDKDGRPLPADRRELTEIRAKCAAGNKAESDVSSGDGKNRFVTHIVVCGDKGATSAETREKLVKALEKAHAELKSEEELSAGHRAEALAALEREIARVKAQSSN